MENQHPLKQKRDSPAGCLTRVYWMIVGNALLFVCAITIARGSSNSFTQIDTLFWILVGSLLTARYVDIRYFNGTTGDGNTATMADFKRYAVLLGFIAIGLWIGVHVFGAFHVDALSSAPE